MIKEINSVSDVVKNVTRKQLNIISTCYFILITWTYFFSVKEFYIFFCKFYIFL